MCTGMAKAMGGFPGDLDLCDCMVAKESDSGDLVASSCVMPCLPKLARRLINTESTKRGSSMS